MTKSYQVSVLVGSLRKDSVNRKAAKVLARLAPSNLKFQFLEIGDLPFFNEDLEAGETPAEWLRFREELSASDAVLFVTRDERARLGERGLGVEAEAGVHLGAHAAGDDF